MYDIKNKTVFITGCCGTVGKELIRQLLIIPEGQGPSKIIGYDNNENQLFFQDQEWLNETRVSFIMGDVRDLDSLQSKMCGVNIVFHCAALKHVILCERSPEQALQTNVNGVQNIIAAANFNTVDKVIFTSSDKAVNPTNVMGTTKLMGERLMTAANSSRQSNGPIFASTRFGNVLGSNGSVIPIFRNQIINGGPVTLTDRGMTRFVMSVSEAVELVLHSVSAAKGGEVFVAKMPVIQIEDLAKAMIEEMSLKEIRIEEIGSKPGEKLYEELMSEEETRRALELDKFFSVLPAFRGIYSDIKYNYSNLISQNVDDPYVSALQKAMSLKEIKEYLNRNDLLHGLYDGNRTSRYWPGDKEEKI
tara:strand:- start:620 stop:1702 length:1083 start_codon:yes stop_codon:yes gene_type:complete